MAATPLPSLNSIVACPLWGVNLPCSAGYSLADLEWTAEKGLIRGSSSEVDRSGGHCDECPPPGLARKIVVLLPRFDVTRLYATGLLEGGQTKHRFRKKSLLGVGPYI